MDAWDVDYYRIKTTSKETSVVIALENQSSTLQPYMQRYDEKKEYLGDKLASTNGQNIEFSFSTTPNLVYFILIGGQNRTSGAYRLTVSEKSGDGT